MTEIESKNIQIDTCDVHFLETGIPGKLTVILLHGMKFQAATWQELGTLDRLSGAGFHAVAIDMPGFGKSPACPVNQDKVIRYFAEQSEQPVILIGPSMGGRIALEFAIKHPGTLGGLVLVGSVGVRENKKRLAEIHVPTLLVWGGNDQISPVENSEILHSAIPGSSKIIIEGAPHPCYLDKPGIWHNELIRFLTTLN